MYTDIKHKWGWGWYNANHASFVWGKLSKYPFQIKCMSLQYVRELPHFCFKQGTWDYLLDVEWFVWLHEELPMSTTWEIPINKHSLKNKGRNESLILPSYLVTTLK